jgi:hypothetical protein
MMIWLALTGVCEMALPQGGEAVVNLVIENQTDALSLDSCSPVTKGGWRCSG